MPNLTRRKNQPKATATGSRKKKGQPGDENKLDGIGHAQTSRVVPKPRPLKPASKVLSEPFIVDEETEGAAVALVSLNKPQSRKLSTDSAPREPNWDRDYHEIYHPNSPYHPYAGSEGIGTTSAGEDEEELDSSGKEEEVDELEDDSDDERMSAYIFYLIGSSHLST